MFSYSSIDLHLHLNGSFSLQFLQETAKKNGVEAAYDALMKKREEYKAVIAQPPTPELKKFAVKLLWEQFSFIHTIIQTKEDIFLGTQDVIDHSKARYLEIRTTPKESKESTWEEYTDTFVKGIIAGNEKHKGSKIARGLLSLDRTVHTEELAYPIIDRVAEEKIRSGMLTGIDIGGNFLKERKLTGEALARVIHYTLSKNLGIAIHVGEADTALEKQDVDFILASLESWSLEQTSASGNPLHGRVRLGHGIFLTDQQRLSIAKLQIPMEICPACHEKLNWWNGVDKHPVTLIYEQGKFVVSGTDDVTFFDADAEEESQRVKHFFPDQKEMKAEDLCEHQAQFRFQ